MTTRDLINQTIEKWIHRNGIDVDEVEQADLELSIEEALSDEITDVSLDADCCEEE